VLESTFPSDRALAVELLERLARRDASGLLALAVTKDEFADIVWPTLPVSRREVGVSMGYVWQDSYTKSRGHLAQTVDAFGGKPLSLVDIGFTGPETQHGDTTIVRKSFLVVKDADGRQSTIRVFGSVIRQAGRSKVYSYIVD
jgi:hypothetical protein